MPIAVDTTSVTVKRARPRHVALLSSQPFADPCPVPQEHGRVRDARGVAHGRRAAVGIDSLSPLRPAFVHFEIRAVCELLAEAIGTRIAALESFIQAQSELTVRRIEQRMIEAISRDGDWRSALFDGQQSLLRRSAATGVALSMTMASIQCGRGSRHTGNSRHRGMARSKAAHAGLRDSLARSGRKEFAPIIGVASGLVATPLSGEKATILCGFGQSAIRTVTWGGDPYKPVIIGNDPSELSPRRSFAQWHQMVEGTSDPWTPADLTAARLIGESVAESPCNSVRSEC